MVLNNIVFTCFTDSNITGVCANDVPCLKLGIGVKELLGQLGDFLTPPKYESPKRRPRR